MFNIFPPAPYPPPLPPKEDITPEIRRTLINFGWNETSNDTNIYFTHPRHPGYYSWSEALVLEVSRAFLELNK